MNSNKQEENMQRISLTSEKAEDAIPNYQNGGEDTKIDIDAAYGTTVDNESEPKSMCEKFWRWIVRHRDVWGAIFVFMIFVGVFITYIISLANIVEPLRLNTTVGLAIYTVLLIVIVWKLGEWDSKKLKRDHKPNRELTGAEDMAIDFLLISVKGIAIIMINYLIGFGGFPEAIAGGVIYLVCAIIIFAAYHVLCEIYKLCAKIYSIFA